MENQHIEEESVPQTFLGYSYGKGLLVEGFNPYKYANIMKVENPHYVYDKDGLMMSMICAETEAKARRECKKYIFMKRYNLVPVVHWFNNLFNVHKK